MIQQASRTQEKEIPNWGNRMLREAFEEAKRRKRVLDPARYINDPVGFGEDVLGVRYTNDVKSVMRSVLESPVTVARSANGTGKTFAAAHIALWFYTVFPGSKVFLAAAPPLENLENLLWAELMDVVNQHPKGLFSLDKRTHLRIERSENSYIAGVTIPTTGTPAERKGKFSGKHAPYLLFIIDEGDAVPFEVYEGIESCMSGGMARLLILFNPRAQSGPIWTMETQGRANTVHLSAFRHPNVITGDDIIPGAVNRETVVRRINEWTRPTVSGEEPDPSTSFNVPDFLVGTVAKSLQNVPYAPLPGGSRVVIEPAFFYMVLGVYPAQAENQLISAEWIAAARIRWDEWVAVHGETPPQGETTLGLDVAEYGPDFNVPIIRHGDYVERIQRIWQGVDPTMTAQFAADICRAHHINSVVVDGTGAGSGVAPMMAKSQKGLRAISAKVANKPLSFIKAEQGEFYQLRDQLWWALREWLRTQPAMLPPEPLLIDELLCPTYRVDNGKIYVMKKELMRERLRRSPNYADALALTFMPAERARVFRLTD